MKFFMRTLFLCFLFKFLLCSNLTFLCPINTTIDQVNCEIEIGDFTQPSLEIPSNLTIIEYNIDRNAFGGDSPYELGLTNIISLMNGNNSALPNDE